MKKLMIGLGGLLVVQLGLAVVFNMERDDYSAFKPASKLATFKAALVDSIRIEVTNDKSVRLTKNAGQWQLAGLDNFPADQQKVEKLLTTLAGLKKGWPVANSPSAAQRFKVDEQGFERRITLSKENDELAQLYFGTSPGLRKVHARVADEDEIITVPFSLFDASVSRSDWIDKDLLKLDASAISRVELPEFTLQQEDKKWQLADIKADEQMVADKVQTLIGKLAGLRVESVYPANKKPELDKETPPLEITLMQATGDALRYTFSKLKGTGYLLQRSDRTTRFKVADWQVNHIKEVKREELVETKKLDDEMVDDAAGKPAAE